MLTMLVSFPGEKAGFPLFAHALNRSGISLASWTIDLCLYTRDDKRDTKLMLHDPYTVKVFRIGCNVICVCA